MSIDKFPTSVLPHLPELPRPHLSVKLLSTTAFIKNKNEELSMLLKPEGFTAIHSTTFDFPPVAKQLRKTRKHITPIAYGSTAISAKQKSASPLRCVQVVNQAKFSIEELSKAAGNLSSCSKSTDKLYSPLRNFPVGRRIKQRLLQYEREWASPQRRWFFREPVAAVNLAGKFTLLEREKMPPKIVMQPLEAVEEAVERAKRRSMLERHSPLHHESPLDRQQRSIVKAQLVDPRRVLVPVLQDEDEGSISSWVVPSPRYDTPVE